MVSLPLGLLIIVADGVLLMLVNRLYWPDRLPSARAPWVIAAFFYFDAWPLFITQNIFPQAPGHASGGPTFLAVVAAGLIDLIVFSAIVYALLSWRARRKAHA